MTWSPLCITNAFGCCSLWFLQKNRTFYVTALIIPKQESTSDSVRWLPLLCSVLFLIFVKGKLLVFVLKILLPAQCQTTNEEEIFDVQDKQSLFPLGWIHVSFQFFTMISPILAYDSAHIHVIYLIPFYLHFFKIY